MSQEQKEVTEDRSESGGPCVPCTVTSLIKQGKNGVKTVPVSPGVSLTLLTERGRALVPTAVVRHTKDTDENLQRGKVRVGRAPGRPGRLSLVSPRVVTYTVPPSPGDHV